MTDFCPGERGLIYLVQNLTCLVQNLITFWIDTLLPMMLPMLEVFFKVNFLDHQEVPCHIGLEFFSISSEMLFLTLVLGSSLSAMKWCSSHWSWVLLYHLWNVVPYIELEFFYISSEMLFLWVTVKKGKGCRNSHVLDTSESVISGSQNVIIVTDLCIPGKRKSSWLTWCFFYPLKNWRCFP